METLTERLTAVRERIAAAARRVNRDPATIRLVGVTKAHPVEVIRAALDAGLSDIGENRVQEAEAKMGGACGGTPSPDLASDRASSDEQGKESRNAL